MVQHAVDQLRGSVWAMRAMPLEGRSFVTALQSLATRLQDGDAPRVVVHVDGVERDIPPAIAGDLVLVAQEAVVNAKRHAAATIIDIIAVFADASVGVVIQDDGQGFDTSLRADSGEKHFGIDGMEDRIRRLGGTLTVDSRLGAGATITAHVPSSAAVAEPSTPLVVASRSAV